MTDAARWEKLPGWAQREHLAATREIADLKEQLATMKGELPKSRVRVKGYRLAGWDVHLPDDLTIEFDVINDTGRAVPVRLMLTHDNPARLEINANDRIAIVPSASNAVGIYIHQRDKP